MDVRNIYTTLDQEIHRGYTKLRNKIPNKHIPYFSFGLWFFGMLPFSIGETLLCKRFGVSDNVCSWTYAILVSGPEIHHDIRLLFQRNEMQVASGPISLDSLNGFDILIGRCVRLPLFLTGSGLVIKSLYDIFMNLTKGEPLSDLTIPSLYLGGGVLAHVTSIYIKDKDDKYSNGKPLLERGFDYLYNKLKSKSQLIPARVSYETLEDKI